MLLWQVRGAAAPAAAPAAAAAAALRGGWKPKGARPPQEHPPPSPFSPFPQIKWLREGNLWNNVTTLRHLIITPCENAQLPCFQGPDGRAYAQPDGISPPPPAIPCPCVYYNTLAAPDPPIINPADHADNFTIPIVEAAWLLLTLALSVALFARRARYELFLATHHAVLLFFAAGLVHAWSHWYYTAAGLLLFAFDKVMRGVNAARAVRVLGLEVARPGVVRLRVSSGFLRGRALYAGQYAWLCVPAVSPLEWHPFTVASPPADAAGAGGELTFFIKSMGAGTWTGRLAELARALRAAQEDADARGGHEDPVAPPAVSIDGPYGRVGALEGRDTLVLFAGGIGVTPVHALACELAARRREKGGAAGALPAGLARVHVVWVVRDAELLEAFAEGLAPLLSDAGGFFTVHVHVSNSRAPLLSAQSAEGAGLLLAAEDAGAAGSDGGAVGAGWARQSACDAVAAAAKLARPDPAAILSAAVREARTRHAGGGALPHDAVLAFVCGPPALVEGVSRAAFALGVDFHSETCSF
jgi:NAD(P)H-flavin reductase